MSYRFAFGRPPAVAAEGMVATSQPLATRAGLRALERGGNAADDGALRLVAQSARVLDLGAAEHAPVARGQRLGDRRRRAQDVDDDPERGGGLFLRREGDMDSHATRVR